MRIRLLSPGQRLPAWQQQGFEEYARRLSGAVRLELVEIPLPRRTPASAVEKMRAEEARRLRAACAPGARQVALDERGKAHSTRQLAARLDDWLQGGADVDLLMGGPDGLADALRRECAETWSLSPLTFPHGLARIVIAEQVYRAWSVLQGHPYHRG